VTVLGVQWRKLRLSKRRTARVVVVNFSGALDPGHAQDLGDYRLVGPGRDKKFGNRDDKLFRLAAATYDASAHTVTLTPRGKVPKQPVQLTIKASGVLDTLGRQLDGNGDGQTGDDFVRRF
jgi:hypothetical protein